MEKLINTAFIKQDSYQPGSQILQVKEFLLLFYGASWDEKSVRVGKAINELLVQFNRYQSEGNEPLKMKIEVVYASADTSQLECLEFVRKQTKPWASFNWNDERIIQVNEFYNVTAVPTVLVLNKNLDLVTRTGADDLLNLSPITCRNYWVELLKEQLSQTEGGEEEDQ